jgi:hypothetical protein
MSAALNKIVVLGIEGFEPARRAPMIRNAASTIFGVLGATIGGVIGFGLYVWLRRTQALYGLILPGALLGLGCGLLARHRSLARGVACGLAALVLGLYSEWHEAPFVADRSFGYFLTHLDKLRFPVPTLGMTVLGALFAVWWGKDAMGGFRAKPNTH